MSRADERGVHKAIEYLRPMMRRDVELADDGEGDVTPPRPTSAPQQEDDDGA